MVMVFGYMTCGLKNHLNNRLLNLVFMLWLINIGHSNSGDRLPMFENANVRIIHATGSNSGIQTLAAEVWQPIIAKAQTNKFDCTLPPTCAF